MIGGVTAKETRNCVGAVKGHARIGAWLLVTALELALEVPCRRKSLRHREGKSLHDAAMGLGALRWCVLMRSVGACAYACGRVFDVVPLCGARHAVEDEDLQYLVYTQSSSSSSGRLD